MENGSLPRLQKRSQVIHGRSKSSCVRSWAPWITSLIWAALRRQEAQEEAATAEGEHQGEHGLRDEGQEHCQINLRVRQWLSVSRDVRIGAFVGNARISDFALL